MESALIASIEEVEEDLSEDDEETLRMLTAAMERIQSKRKTTARPANLPKKAVAFQPEPLSSPVQFHSPHKDSAPTTSALKGKGRPLQETPAPTPSSSRPVRPPTITPTPAPRPEALTPQFRFTSAIEESRSPDAMNDFLDQKVLVSLREMLAASPEWRKTMREICTTKRIATPPPTVGIMESFMAETWQKYGDEIVGAHSLPLRVIYPTFEGGQSAECILDQGAQVIAMRKDIWENLGLALNPDNVMVMESTNST